MNNVEQCVGQVLEGIDARGRLAMTTVQHSNGKMTRHYRWLTPTGKAVIVRGLWEAGWLCAIRVKHQTECPDGWWLAVDEEVFGEQEATGADDGGLGKYAVPVLVAAGLDP